MEIRADPGDGGHRCRPARENRRHLKHLLPSRDGVLPPLERHQSREVQFGRGFALIGIAEKQKGQSLVVGAAAFAPCLSVMKRFAKSTLPRIGIP